MPDYDSDEDFEGDWSHEGDPYRDDWDGGSVEEDDHLDPKFRSYDIEGPGEYDAHFMADDDEEVVNCVACRRVISSYADQCPYCGVHFAGEAWQLKLAGESTARDRFRHVAMMLFIAFLIWVFSYALT